MLKFMQKQILYEIKISLESVKNSVAASYLRHQQNKRNHT